VLYGEYGSFCDFVTAKFLWEISWLFFYEQFGSKTGRQVCSISTLRHLSVSGGKNAADGEYASCGI